jgi:hypothetical protein
VNLCQSQRVCYPQQQPTKSRVAWSSSAICTQQQQEQRDVELCQLHHVRQPQQSTAIQIK